MVVSRNISYSRSVKSIPNSASGSSGNNPFATKPGPPSLPPKEQKEFEELVRKAQAPLSTSPKTHVTSADGLLESIAGEAAERHPDARKPIAPEFEGDVNPKTGEKGGPKREPVKHNDWSFGGRVTDF
ncbi:putative mitochondrial protein, conserved [Serendipita sp. 411]|nr:putative mitochondrial protein, conserved [Serendipita sp. 400]KAG8859806.1 putative mitochondrial protein, conserved [Serendipita sp. 411]